MEVLTRDVEHAVRSRVSSRRPLACHRAKRHAAHSRQEQPAVGPSHRHAEAARAAGRRIPRRDGTSAVHRRTAGSICRIGSAARVRGAAAAAAGRSGCRASGARRGAAASRQCRRAPAPGGGFAAVGSRARRTAAASVQHGDRPREDQQEQRVDRSAGHLPRHRPNSTSRAACISVRASRGTAGTLVLHARRTRHDAERAGPEEPARQDPSRQRRRERSERQSVREHAGADTTIWSYGHRNPEGLAWEPGTGKLWESEHGPTGGDEINIIQKGHNYGWGVASKGIQAASPRRSEAAWTIRSSITRRRSRRRDHVLHRQPLSAAGRTQPLRRRASSASSCAGSRSAAKKWSSRKCCSPVRPRARHRPGTRRLPLYRAAESDRWSGRAVVGGDARNDHSSDAGD